MDLQCKRIQFTPDLMPSDISGTEILEEDESTGHRFVKFVQRSASSQISSWPMRSTVRRQDPGGLGLR